MVKRVDLILPAYLGRRPPLGRICQPYSLLRLGTYIKKCVPRIEVNIYNEELTSSKEFMEKVDGDIIGISANTLTYSNCLEIAKTIKEHTNSLVVLGGSHPTFMWKEILEKRSYIDYVVVGEGEEPLYRLTAGDDPEKIPGLAYRKSGAIKLNARENFLDFEQLPIVDRNLVNMNEHFQFAEDAPYLKPSGLRNDGLRLANVYWQDWCSWKEITWNGERGGCIYCSMRSYDKREVEPEKIWDEVRYLTTEHNVNVIFSASDSITGDRKWLQRIVKSRPLDVDMPFLRLYARADEIDFEMITILKTLNTYDVVIGVESGSNIGLRKLRKGVSLKQVHKAINLLTDHDIGVTALFLEMYPGESKRIAEENYLFAEELIKNNKINFIGSSLLIPLPGSMIHDELLDREPKYANLDEFPIKEMQDDFARHFCPLPKLYYEAQARKINALSDCTVTEGEWENCLSEVY